ESIMQQYNCSQKSQAIMLIAVDELFSNIAYYAYKGKEGGGNGTIRIEIKDKVFKMQLIDNGIPFNPLAHLDPNYINSSAEERTNKGGLGIFMVRRSVDDMQYVYENGQNILTIIKTIPEMHEEEFKDSYSTTRD
ncbi:MAG: ATP-binding protein, partial [Bacilli bacterium]|nr:ATP-binding protein [Bacilli bacterium]